MSHSKEREEKICLNCNTDLNGRFCHVCGQENLEPKETVWSLVSHFFYDITHFDGKFFSTLGYLVRKPGFLSKEYLRGRRASYLNPIRMYVFSSALFFIIFFAMFDPRKWNLGNDADTISTDSIVSRSFLKNEALKKAETQRDSLQIEQYYRELELKDSEPGEDKSDSTEDRASDSADKKKKGWKVTYDDSDYESVKEYDSVQRTLPPAKRHGWMSRKINVRFIELRNKYKGKKTQFLKDVLDKFLHTFPYLLFVSLPLYALFLKLLYIRRKRFYYVDHGMFLIHLYIFTFIVLLIIFALSKLKDVTDWGWLGIPQGLLILYGVIYTMKAMRNFYGQGWGKTIVKFILLNFLASISLIFLFSLFFLLAVFGI